MRRKQHSRKKDSTYPPLQSPQQPKTNECPSEAPISLLHPKYQGQADGAAECLRKNEFRVIQLPTIAKLTTDNESVVKDFPVRTGLRMGTGVSPYSQYTIRVCDAEGAELDIVVHQHDEYALLCPIVTGFRQGQACAFLFHTDNWRIRELASPAWGPDLPLPANFQGFQAQYTETGRSCFRAVNTEEFTGGSLQVLRVDTSGLFDSAYALKKGLPEKNIFDRWLASEKLVQRGNIAAPCSNGLVLQIWLHTLELWRDKCLKRKVIIRQAGGRQTGQETVLDGSISKYVPTRRHIIDLDSDIVVYEDCGISRREFRGYHMTMTTRCGHFRHYPNGAVIYIPPTTVHFKKVLPDAANGLVRPLVYRNVEDFLREKSYLEDLICQRLKQEGIRFEREKMFPWMGRKRLDFYLPEYGVAIECQGVQHFFRYGADDEDFGARKQRDEDKFLECSQNGVQVLYFLNEEIPLPDWVANKELYFRDASQLILEIQKGLVSRMGLSMVKMA